MSKVKGIKHILVVIDEPNRENYHLLSEVFIFETICLIAWFTLIVLIH